jgi:hypothetical protein
MTDGTGQFFPNLTIVIGIESDFEEIYSSGFHWIR